MLPPPYVHLAHTATTSPIAAASWNVVDNGSSESLAANFWSGVGVVLGVDPDVNDPLLLHCSGVLSVHFEGREGDVHVMPVVGGMAAASLTAQRGAITTPVILPIHQHYSAVGSSNGRLVMMTFNVQYMMAQPQTRIALGICIHAHATIQIASINGSASIYGYTEQIANFDPLI